ncbi:MAG: helix-turn-helix domain-containing protein [Bdellovibrionales bacterium]
MAKPVLKPVARQPDKDLPFDNYHNITRDKIVVKNAAESYTMGTSGVRRSVKGKYPFYPDGKNREFDKRKWLNVRELAEYIGTTPAGIRSLVYREKIVAYKPFGGMLLFNKADIDRLIESRRAVAWYEKD